MDLAILRSVFLGAGPPAFLRKQEGEVLEKVRDEGTALYGHLIRAIT
jgi:hypothetical protein